MKTIISTAEQQRLLEREQIIERGLSNFVEVGTALLEIRDERLYRATHKTFEAYCRERWSMTCRRANQLVSAAETVRQIGNGNNCSQTPATESQARPLTKLPPEQQAEAWSEAVESAPGGKVTAAHVEEVVQNRLQRPVPEIMLPPEEADDSPTPGSREAWDQFRKHLATAGAEITAASALTVRATRRLEARTIIERLIKQLEKLNKEVNHV